MSGGIFICSKCGKRVGDNTRLPWCECGGIWNLKKGKRNCNSISLGEGNTPIIEIAEGVLLKMDYYMPTLSFKDRGAASLVSHCKEIGIQRVVEDSSGNAGNSIAAYCAKAGIECEIFVPEGTSPNKIKLISSYGAKVTVTPGSRDNCALICRDKVKMEEVYYASHVYNPYFIEGVKTYIYEAKEQLERMPETVFSPVGNGTMLLGIIKGLEEMLEDGSISRVPQIVAVQSKNCAPIYQGYINGDNAPAKIIPQRTLAEGIAIGEPGRGSEIMEVIKRHNAEVVAVTESEIESAMTDMLNQGIFCEETSAATYAGYKKYSSEHKISGDVLIPACGAGLKTLKV